MNKKIKLTDLRQFEISQEKINFIKGGQSVPGAGTPITCSCYAVCNDDSSGFQQMQQQASSASSNPAPQR